MSIRGPRYAFAESVIAKAPDRPGVFALFDGDTPIYFGSATKSIRDRLLRHSVGDEGSGTQNASHYKREVCKKPKEREQYVLDAYLQMHGKMPRCNET